MKRSPLSPISAKRLAALGGYVTSTFDKPRAALKPSRRPTGPDRLTVEAVLERDQHACAWCGGGLYGERGTDWHIHHRRPRRVGGDPRPDTNLPANLVALHRDCHRYVESHRLEALDAGFLLHAEARPYLNQIRHAIHGQCWLRYQGGIRR